LKKGFVAILVLVWIEKLITFLELSNQKINKKALVHFSKIVLPVSIEEPG